MRTLCANECMRREWIIAQEVLAMTSMLGLLLRSWDDFFSGSAALARPWCDTNRGDWSTVTHHSFDMHSTPISFFRTSFAMGGHDEASQNPFQGAVSSCAPGPANTGDDRQK